MIAPELDTPRLHLRPFRPADGAALYAYLSDPQVVRFEPYEVYTRADAEREAIRRSQDPAFIAVCKKDGTLIGNLYLPWYEDGITCEIGYVFHQKYWHQGYATEAARAAMSDAFARGAHRFIAKCNPLNPASWHLMERLGMRREATFIQNVAFRRDQAGQPIWQDTYQYAILSSEWHA